MPFNKVEGQRLSSWEQNRNKALKTWSSAGVLENVLQIVWEAASLCVPICWVQTHLPGRHVEVCVTESPPTVILSVLLPPLSLPLLTTLFLHGHHSHHDQFTHTLDLRATSLKGYGACGAGYRHGNQTLWVLSLCTSWHSPDCKLAINCFSCCLICLQFLSTSVFNGVSVISQCQPKRGCVMEAYHPSRLQRAGALNNSRNWLR